MNSPSARRNAARLTNPARMRLLLALEKEGECAECGTRHTEKLIRQPKDDGSGGYESVCRDCVLPMFTADELADLADSL